MGFWQWLETKTGYLTNIEQDTIKNADYRKVLYTSNYSQLVLMSLKPKEEIGFETHGVDQFFRVEDGEGEVILDGERYPIKDGSAIVVPAGTRHNIVNKGVKPLKLYTIYSPPHHKDGIVVKKKSAETPEEYDGKTSF